MAIANSPKWVSERPKLWYQSQKKQKVFLTRTWTYTRRGKNEVACYSKSMQLKKTLANWVSNSLNIEQEAYFWWFLKSKVCCVPIVTFPLLYVVHNLLGNCTQNSCLLLAEHRGLPIVTGWDTVCTPWSSSSCWLSLSSRLSWLSAPQTPVGLCQWWMYLYSCQGWFTLTI